jgi:hypothetical protein
MDRLFASRAPPRAGTAGSAGTAGTAGGAGPAASPGGAGWVGPHANKAANKAAPVQGGEPEGPAAAAASPDAADAGVRARRPEAAHEEQETKRLLKAQCLIGIARIREVPVSPPQPQPGGLTAFSMPVTVAAPACVARCLAT